MRPKPFPFVATPRVHELWDELVYAELDWMNTQWRNPEECRQAHRVYFMKWVKEAVPIINEIGGFCLHCYRPNAKRYLRSIAKRIQDNVYTETQSTKEPFMQSGHYKFSQHHISNIRERIEDVIRDNNITDVDEFNVIIGRGYTAETIAKLEEAVQALNKAAVYADRVDWLLSGYGTEESFRTRLECALGEMK